MYCAVPTSRIHRSMSSCVEPVQSSPPSKRSKFIESSAVDVEQQIIKSAPITAGVGGNGHAKSVKSPKQGDMAQDSPMDTNSPANGKGQEGGDEFDTNLYSRMLYTVGHTAMTRLRSSSVLISGMGGVGVEIAKNLILGGVRNVTVQDTQVAEWNDLSTQYYLTESSIGKNRAEVSVTKLAELNDSVNVKSSNVPLAKEFVSSFDLVILTSSPLSEQLTVNEWTRAANKLMTVVDTRGLFAQVFNDFGPAFVVEDGNGEQVHETLLEYIIPATGDIGMLEDAKHNLEDGDFITFSEVKGMKGINESAPMKVTVKKPSVITVGPEALAKFGDYLGGGRIRQVKQPKTMAFKSLKESLKAPEMLITDFAKFDRPQQMHALYQALHAFVDAHKRLPLPKNADDFQKLKALVPEFEGELDDKFAAEFASEATGNVAPLTSFIGGVAAQEAMKAVTGIFTPMHQWMYFDALECLPGEWSEFDLAKVPAEKFQPSGNRYDGYTAVFGADFVEHIKRQKWFVVGAGAIGCELLKNFAMMGLACGEGGLIKVTDMDQIELSNLNRQFLFRRSDIGSKKSEVATRAVKVMNKEIKVQCMAERVGGDTENIFDDVFFNALDGVANALDNVEARQYMDRRCVYYQLPLLESGTLGSKGNTQVVFPHLTESYSSSADPPEKQIPICTLKNFPNAIEHTIQWARDLFTGMYENPAETANSWLADARAFNERAERMHAPQKLELYTDVKAALITQRPASPEDCVKWARDLFEEQFHNTIAQLLHNFPPDQKTDAGNLFWSGAKRCPHPLKFDVNNAEHFEFVYSGAILRAQAYRLKPIMDKSKVVSILAAHTPPPFQPRSGVRIATTTAEAEAQSGDADNGADDGVQSAVDALLIALAKYRPNDDSVMLPIDFEKDDPTNHHMDWVTSCSNLRASNYDIAPADLVKTKQIAGNIIPAIATTTAAVAGLVTLEMYKVIAAGPAKETPAKVPMDVFKNSFLNLALPFFAFSEPIQVPSTEWPGGKFSLWDSLTMQGPMTLQDVKDRLEKEWNLDMSMVSSGVTLMYSFFMDQTKAKLRLKMTIPELLQNVSQKPLPPHVRAIVVEAMVTDLKTDEDVEIPYIKYILSDEEVKAVRAAADK